MKIQLKYIVLITLCSLLLQGCTLNVNDDKKMTTNITENTDVPVNLYDKNIEIPENASSVPNQHITVEEPHSAENIERKVIVPDLPLEAKIPDEFIVKDWILLDSVKLDFNNDGTMDLIGVLEHETTEEADNNLFYPRVLFAIASSNGYYKLDFKEINLIRTRNEGGVFGDPYQPLTTKSNTFTINTYGGSAWRWSEAKTFRYIDNDWFLIQEENTYLYGPLLTHYEKHDYESGKGFIGYNNDDFGFLENVYYDKEIFDTPEEADYDLSFRIKAESPITLMQASQRWWLAPDRLETIPQIIEISHLNNPIKFMDENYILYTLLSEDRSIEYLSVYDRHRKSTAVVALTYRLKDGGFKDDFSDAKIYNGMIYYEESIYNKVKSEKNGVVTVSLEHTASQLVRLDIDGSGIETVFSYNFLDENKTISNWAPYCSLGFNFVKEGIIIYLYNGDKFTQYYLLETNSKSARFLGIERGTPTNWLGDLSLIGRIDIGTDESLNIHMNIDLKNGNVEGSYYYDKYGQEIKLNGYLTRGNLELYEEGGTGRMYGLIVDDLLKGVWTDGEKVLPMIVTMEGLELPKVYTPDEDLLKFEGFYEGKNATDYQGSNIKIIPIFDDLAYIEVFAYDNTNNNANNNTDQSVNTGGFCGIAVFDNGGLNYQANEKIHDKNETIVFRLTKEENDDINLYTNDFGYNCGVGVIYDFVYNIK